MKLLVVVVVGGVAVTGVDDHLSLLSGSWAAE